VNRKILVIGLPAAGKATLANTLAPLLKGVVFNADVARANCRAISASATKTESRRRAAWDGYAIAWLKLAAQ
jgi:predicted kinase